jgi:hypothetical protein
MVGGYFNCGGNQLECLEGAPYINNLLKSLDGALGELGYDFSNNPLFYCHDNPVIFTPEDIVKSRNERKSLGESIVSKIIGI